MLSIICIQFIIPTIDRSTFNEIIFNILPPSDNEIFRFIDNVIDELYGRTDISIISITAITLLWSASRGFKSIATGIRNIYKNNENMGYIKNLLFSFVYTIIFIVMLILAVVMLFFGRVIQTYVHDKNSILLRILNFSLEAKGFIFFIMLILVFSLAYKGMARHEMAFKNQMIGALFATSGWLIFSFFYTIYIDRFSNYSYIYGSLTAITLLMLWLYFGIIILFLGAEINVWFYKKYIKQEKKYVQ